MQHRYEVRGPNQELWLAYNYADALMQVLRGARSLDFRGWEIDTSDPTSCFKDLNENVWQITAV